MAAAIRDEFKSILKCPQCGSVNCAPQCPDCKIARVAITPQERYQLRHKKKKKCALCDARAHKWGRCRKHYKRAKQDYRKRQDRLKANDTVANTARSRAVPNGTGPTN